jgi:hypothetical protein
MRQMQADFRASSVPPTALGVRLLDRRPSGCSKISDRRRPKVNELRIDR